MSQTATHTDPYRWVMLTGLWLIYACFGLIGFSMAPLVSRIAGDLEIEMSAMGFVLGAWPLVYIFFAVPAGAALDRYGVRRGLLAGIVFIGLSAVARAWSEDVVQLFLAVALFGLGGPLVSIGAPKLISRWFRTQEQGIAMGLYMTAPSLGALASLTLTSAVMMPMFDGRWRMVLMVYAGVCLAVALTWFGLTRHGSSRKGDSPGDVTRWRDFADLLGTPEVKLVLIIGIGAFAFVHAFNNWLPEILRMKGLSEADAGLWAGLPVAIGIVGALIIPSVASPGRRVPLLAGLFVLAAGTSTWLAWSGPADLLPVLICLGIARSAMWPIAVLLLMQARSVRESNMGAAGGMFFTAGEIGGVAGPVLLGLVVEATGSFEIALYLLSASCVALAIVTLLVRWTRANHAMS